VNVRPLVSAALFSVLVAGGCSRDDYSGPPQMRLGRDECIECGMIISEDRSSAAMLIEKGGRREYMMFDDIGCLLDYERDHSDEYRHVQSFVRDYSSGEWLEAGKAHYLFADRKKLLTPMGTGMAAFGSEEGVRRAQAEYGGEIMSLPDLGRARREWLRALYGEQDPDPHEPG
jgi:copper chaperone NosL